MVGRARQNQSGTGRRGCLRLTAILACAIGAMVALPSAADAVKLANGDLVVSDKRFGAVTDGPGALFQVNPGSGAQTIISQAGSFVEPEDVVILANGNLLVADKGENGQPALTTNGLLIRVNAATGAQTVVTSAGNLINPTALTVAPNGLVFIADRGPTSGPPQNADGRVVQVDPKTGAQVLVATGGLLQEPRGIAVSPKDGSLFVSDVGDDQLVRITNGQQTAISTGAPLTTPQHMTLDPAGSLWLADTGTIFKVPTPNGPPTAFAANTTLSGAAAIGRELSGSLVTASRGTSLVRTTTQTVSSAFSVGGSFRELTGISVAQSCGGSVANPVFVGTPGKDKMVGTSSADVFVGGKGKDTIKGLAGKDIICGGPGKDKLIGGKGADRLLGQGDNDTCNGGPGKNKLKSC
jgi:sugar lactone lactonase YvrE